MIGPLNKWIRCSPIWKSPNGGSPKGSGPTYILFPLMYYLHNSYCVKSCPLEGCLMYEIKILENTSHKYMAVERGN